MSQSLGPKKNQGRKTKGTRAGAPAIRQIGIELRRDPGREREVAGAAAVLAAIPVLAAAVESEADRAGALRAAGGARGGRLIAFAQWCGDHHLRFPRPCTADRDPVHGPILMHHASGS